MLSLSARVTRGPNKGRPLVLARNRHGKIVTAFSKDGTGRVEHAREEEAARFVFGHGHGAWFSANGRGAQAAFHKPRVRRRAR